MALQPLTLAFHGAARTVTGSRHLMRFGERRWLFDCGLYQGHRDEADRINRTFAFAPGELDAVIVSHAHLDHTGNLPTLSHEGFRGPIHLTSGTADLSKFMLQDSAFLMQKDVEHVNRVHGKKGHPRTPLYTMADVEDTLARFVTHDYHTPWQPFDGVNVQYHDAGHILGSAMATFEFASEGRTLRVLMGGDLGRPGRPILRDPERPPGPDVLVLESTYGDRLHGNERETNAALAEVMTRTIARGGRVIVPAFAVGRTQELVAVLHMLIDMGRVPDVPVIVDSPMARNATSVYKRHPECFDEHTRELLAQGGGAPFGFRRLHYIESPEESRALNDFRDPCIIVSASGMCEGGRVVHHLQHGLGDPKNTVLFVGFQGEGTLGRRLREGAETVNVFGEPVRVRAEIVGLDGFSAHADQKEMLDWVLALDPLPKRIFLVHGELPVQKVFAALLQEKTGVDVRIPERGEEFDLWTS
jgi:metallo-beta-lactamase family protein